MIKIIIKYLTPFIASLVDIINGVFLYIEYILKQEVDCRFYDLISHSTGSSLLFVAFVLVMADDMCKFYKASCWALLIMHMISITYIYTPIAVTAYIYIFLLFSMFSLITITISVLGHKAYVMLNWVCKHLRVR